MAVGGATCTQTTAADEVTENPNARIVAITAFLIISRSFRDGNMLSPSRGCAPFRAIYHTPAIETESLEASFIGKRRLLWASGIKRAKPLPAAGQ
jgi:hypothetical protein